VEKGEFYAVKEVKRTSAKIDKKQAQKEVELLKTLIHPNVVKFFEFIETESYFYFVMEYLESGSLFRTMKRFGVFPENLLQVQILVIIIS
jgi:serine/threonine protein kinase